MLHFRSSEHEGADSQSGQKRTSHGYDLLISFIHGEPFHLKSAGATIVFKIPGTETSNTLHFVHKVEQSREVSEDRL